MWPPRPRWRAPRRPEGSSGGRRTAGPPRIPAERRIVRSQSGSGDSMLVSSVPPSVSSVPPSRALDGERANGLGDVLGHAVGDTRIDPDPKGSLGDEIAVLERAADPARLAEVGRMAGEVAGEQAAGADLSGL